jgi:hypothetical protein
LPRHVRHGSTTRATPRRTCLASLRPAASSKFFSIWSNSDCLHPKHSLQS